MSVVWCNIVVISSTALVKSRISEQNKRFSVDSKGKLGETISILYVYKCSAHMRKKATNKNIFTGGGCFGARLFTS